ncbi:glycosyltransferase [Massilia sp. GCM10020059]|uniref:Glycosyltransferase n=1 Tax=Massilia agrisoli TaxID=2892444 RepID=A0ABS8IXY1_9BURK|nr:glycosyltransferase [Massilia agrisoli]MCC6073460.1 glycosyltransferase [Massilia agrisoli]
MRLVFDLQCCQAGIAPASLARVQDLVRQCAPHEAWIALSSLHPSSIESLRLAFAGLLPPERIRVYELPPAQTGGAELIRENFFAALGADVVYTPRDEDPANELQRLVDAAAAQPKAQAKGQKLAYISPLPPAKSGIADYSAELIVELARFYDITLVTDQPVVDDARLNGKFQMRDVAWFEQNAGGFERVLYHFGNSHAHQHMFELIRRHPGIVVLHDFFFSGILDNLDREGYLPQAYTQALYESHGYTGLLEHRAIGRNPSIWKHPVNKGVLDNAAGVIVHSDFSRQLAEQWYGAGAAEGWRTIPLLRGKPEGIHADDARSAARARLGIGADEFIVCTFGMLGRTKKNEELLDAYLSSALVSDPRCRLLFVGENDAGPYGEALAKKIAGSVASDRIRITGFVSANEYADYLAACDIAVQLRGATRGETSAAVLDCLLYGAPTIVNAHGSTASISDALLLKIPDEFARDELAGALALLHQDATLRKTYSTRALAHMREHHAPAKVGAQFADAIEHFAAHSRHGHYRRLVDTLANMPGHEPTEAGLTQMAKAIAFNQPPTAPRQLLVDVSAVVQTDIKTGIQRVVRSILLALIADPPPGYRIEPVFSHGGNRSYQYARQFTLAMVGETGEGALALEDAPIEVRPGDIFLGLDLFTTGTSQNAPLLQSMRDHGVQVYFVVYDLLPVLRPDVFPYGTEQYFGEFLRTVTRVSDGLLCISRAVADELIDWIARQPAKRPGPLNIGYFHLGADIDASAPSFGLPDDAGQILEAVRSRPSFLMVGTVEPRKGHAQALAAFELLWKQGSQINLVIVGKQGWMVDKLVERIAKSPESGRRLFWLPGASDEMLLKLYASSAALLAPSEGEGFGLPLIEAAQHNIPIIARSLPVFREVAGDHAWYFEGLAPHDLSDSVAKWLVLNAEGKAPQSTGMTWLTWSDSAGQVLNAVEKQQWYKVVPGA